MSQIIIKIIVSIFFDITILLVAKNLIREKVEKKNTKIIMWILTHMFITFLIFKNDYYDNIVSIISIILAILMVADIYEIKLKKAVILATLCCLTMALPDLLGSAIFAKYTTLEYSRNSIFIMTGMSIVNCLVCVGIFEIKQIKQFMRKIIDRKEEKGNSKIISYSVLIFYVVGLLYYFLGNIYSLKLEYIISSFAIVVFVILSYVYTKERSEYETLTLEYDILYKCVQEFEEWIEETQLNIHEYKNQVAKILDMTKEEKVLNVVNKIIKNWEKVDKDMIEQLKGLPKGGLKGLLYYKMMSAKKKEIEMVVDIGKDVKKSIMQMSEEDAEDLSKLIGIYLDNAIEAVETEKNKRITIEIYKAKGKMQFLFSNVVEKGFDSEKIYEKGKSTKGKGRGNGLYFAKKIIKNNPKFCEENRIINNFFVQKISISLE